MLKAGISSGKLYLSAGTVRADNQCQFGKRLYASEIPAAQFALAGRREAAEREMGPAGEYARTSPALTEVLTRWSTAAQL